MTQIKDQGKKRTRISRKKELLQTIISIRVKDKQRIVLEQLSEATSKSVSDIIREALDIWIAKHKKHLP